MQLPWLLCVLQAVGAMDSPPACSFSIGSSSSEEESFELVLAARPAGTTAAFLPAAQDAHAYLELHRATPLRTRLLSRFELLLYKSNILADKELSEQLVLPSQHAFCMTYPAPLDSGALLRSLAEGVVVAGGWFEGIYIRYQDETVMLTALVGRTISMRLFPFLEMDFHANFQTLGRAIRVEEAAQQDLPLVLEEHSAYQLRITDSPEMGRCIESVDQLYTLLTFPGKLPKDVSLTVSKPSDMAPATIGRNVLTLEHEACGFAELKPLYQALLDGKLMQAMRNPITGLCISQLGKAGSITHLRFDFPITHVHVHKLEGFLGGTLGHLNRVSKPHSGNINHLTFGRQKVFYLRISSSSQLAIAPAESGPDHATSIGYCSEFSVFEKMLARMWKKRKDAKVVTVGAGQTTPGDVKRLGVVIPLEQQKAFVPLAAKRLLFAEGPLVASQKLQDVIGGLWCCSDPSPLFFIESKLGVQLEQSHADELNTLFANVQLAGKPVLFELFGGKAPHASQPSSAAPGGPVRTPTLKSARAPTSTAARVPTAKPVFNFLAFARPDKSPQVSMLIQKTDDQAPLFVTSDADFALLQPVPMLAWPPEFTLAKCIVLLTDSSITHFALPPREGSDFAVLHELTLKAGSRPFPELYAEMRRQVTHTGGKTHGMAFIRMLVTRDKWRIQLCHFLSGLPFQPATRPADPTKFLTLVGNPFHYDDSELARLQPLHIGTVEELSLLMPFLNTVVVARNQHLAHLKESRGLKRLDLLLFSSDRALLTSLSVLASFFSSDTEGGSIIKDHVPFALISPFTGGRTHLELTLAFQPAYPELTPATWASPRLQAYLHKFTILAWTRKAVPDEPDNPSFAVAVEDVPLYWLYEYGREPAELAATCDFTRLLNAGRMLEIRRSGNSAGKEMELHDYRKRIVLERRQLLPKLQWLLRLLAPGPRSPIFLPGFVFALKTLHVSPLNPTGGSRKKRTGNAASEKWTLGMFFIKAHLDAFDMGLFTQELEAFLTDSALPQIPMPEPPMPSSISCSCLCSCCASELEQKSRAGSVADGPTPRPAEAKAIANPEAFPSETPPSGAPPSDASKGAELAQAEAPTSQVAYCCRGEMFLPASEAQVSFVGLIQARLHPGHLADRQHLCGMMSVRAPKDAQALLKELMRALLAEKAVCKFVISVGYDFEGSVATFMLVSDIPSSHPDQFALKHHSPCCAFTHTAVG